MPDRDTDRIGQGLLLGGLLLFGGGAIAWVLHALDPGSLAAVAALALILVGVGAGRVGRRP